MDRMDLKQRLMICIVFLAILALATAPVYTIIIAVISVSIQKHCGKTARIAACGVGCVATAIVICLIFTSGWAGIVAAVPSNMLDWLFGLSPWRLIFLTIAFSLSAPTSFENVDQMLSRHEDNRQAKSYKRTSTLDMETRTHLGIFGTTGSGKTTADLKYVEDSIKRGEPLYIISGKNGTDDPRSLLNITKALAQKYHRLLYIVSLNPREKDRMSYNPLQNMTPTEAADTLVSITEYTEPHYKESTKAWLLAIAECLLLAGIVLSLNAICEFYSYDKFSELVKHLVDTGKLNRDDGQHYLSMKNVAEEASLSISRFRNLIMGDGKAVFGDGMDCVSATQAREDGAIFFLDLDSFSYTDFTMAVGRLVIGDLRHIIATETNMDAKKRIIMDELGAYATESLLPLFSQARSYGYQIIISTQSIADLDNISETYSERLLENCGQYLALQLNSSKDAETMANIIGTRRAIETTRKSSGVLLDSSGAGTKKVVHEYKCPVDDLKELRPLQAIYYNKRTPDVVYKVQLDFIVI